MDEDPAATDAMEDEAVGHGVEEGNELFVGEGEGEDVGFDAVNEFGETAVSPPLHLLNFRLNRPKDRPASLIQYLNPHNIPMFKERGTRQIVKFLIRRRLRDGAITRLFRLIRNGASPNQRSSSQVAGRCCMFNEGRVIKPIIECGIGGAKPLAVDRRGDVDVRHLAIPPFVQFIGGDGNW